MTCDPELSLRWGGWGGRLLSHYWELKLQDGLWIRWWYIHVKLADCDHCTVVTYENILTLRKYSISYLKYLRVQKQSIYIENFPALTQPFSHMISLPNGNKCYLASGCVLPEVFHAFVSPRILTSPLYRKWEHSLHWALHLAVLTTCRGDHCITGHEVPPHYSLQLCNIPWRDVSWLI